ncbi:MAG: hypothetical protein HW416_949 [Chloroflexi bacterium]|nr:hypothetical protein [Chloroflexota bacterium]
MYRVGLLDTNQAASEDSVVGRPTFWERMAEIGYSDGGNLAREERTATGVLAQLGDFAAELVRLPVDVIVAPNNATINAAAAATASIPIVMLGVPLDPVAQGWVESLARPGKNITGVVGAPPTVELKRLQLIVEATPGASKVAVLGFGVGTDRLPASLEEAGRSLGVNLLPLPIESRESYEPAFERSVAEGADALLVRLLAINANNASMIGSLAERHRIPAIASSRLFVAAGGATGLRRGAQ